MFLLINRFASDYFLRPPDDPEDEPDDDLDELEPLDTEPPEEPEPLDTDPEELRLYDEDDPEELEADDLLSMLLRVGTE